MIAAEPGLTICGEADSVASAVALLKTSAPDLVLLDLSLPDGSGLELVRLIRQSDATVRMLVLSIHDEALFAVRALRAGAGGYIMKEEAIEALVHAIEEVLADRLFVSPRMEQHILGRLGNGSPVGNDLETLSDRELEVFELIGNGLNTAAIATRLGVSVKTVETYRSNIKAKLDLKDATDLIRCAAAWIEHV
jgi:DNA-binding NarL/FixJ family response regulator